MWRLCVWACVRVCVCVCVCLCTRVCTLSLFQRCVQVCVYPKTCQLLLFRNEHQWHLPPQSMCELWSLTSWEDVPSSILWHRVTVSRCLSLPPCWEVTVCCCNLWSEKRLKQDLSRYNAVKCHKSGMHQNWTDAVKKHIQIYTQKRLHSMYVCIHDTVCWTALRCDSALSCVQ